MNPVFPARKRAEQFSSMVEDPSTAQLHDTGPYADLVPLVGVVASLRETASPEPRPDFVADLRSRLMLAAETALVPDTTAEVEARRQPAPRRSRRERRLAVAIGGFALVTASASMSVAAQTALPGDTLYPLKRAIEDVHANVLRDADDKGVTMLDNASSRLDEVDTLSRNGGHDAEVIARTLQDFTDQAMAASDVLIADYEETGRVSSVEEVRSFTTSSLAALDLLEDVVPAQARGPLLEATRTLGLIDAEALSVCPSCGTSPAIVDAAATDLVGPLYAGLLEPVMDPAPPVRRPPTPRADPPPASPSNQPTKPTKPSVSAAPATPAAEPETAPEVTPDQTPTLPQAPTGNGGKNTPDNPLGPLTTGVGEPLDDVIGDLLTGTSGVVDGLLGTTGDITTGR